MKQGRPSATAYRVAIRRAAHQLHDAPIVFEDPLALQILGERGRAAARAKPKRIWSFGDRYMRAFLAARSRYAEDELKRAVSRGVSQYVVLGAGLDTFAYRNPFPPGTLRVFEVDYPATQAWKRGLLAHARIPVPESPIYVPVDFETQALQEELQRTGLDPARPAFFSWLGVTPYLQRETVLATLGLIPKWLPKGSAIAFDFGIPRASLTFIQRFFYDIVARRVAMLGEPFKSSFDPDALVADLKTMEYTDVELMRPADINERYFQNRADKLRVSAVGYFLRAQV